MPYCKFFLVTEAERSISGVSRHFNNIGIYFFFLQGKKLKDIRAILAETLGVYASSFATVKNLVAQFKRVVFPRVLCLVVYDS